jgi:hypothetical protein
VRSSFKVSAARARAGSMLRVYSARNPLNPSGGHGQLLAFPILLLLAPLLLNSLGFRLPLSAPRFQRFSFLLRGQSSNVRWVCCWREVILTKHRMQWVKRGAS